MLFFWATGGVSGFGWWWWCIFFPLRDLGNQAFSHMFVSTFLCFCAWETEVEPSICCRLCLEMGHEGDISMIQYVPSYEPLQLTCRHLPEAPAVPASCCEDNHFIRKGIIASGEH